MNKKLNGVKFCPVEKTKEFIKLRPKIKNLNEQFFIFRDGTTLKADQLRRIVRETITDLRLDGNLYDIHSFRIGRATDLEKHNINIDRIKQLGRWKSNAVYKYLRRC